MNEHVLFNVNTEWINAEVFIQKYGSALVDPGRKLKNLFWKTIVELICKQNVCSVQLVLYVYFLTSQSSRFWIMLGPSDLYTNKANDTTLSSSKLIWRYFERIVSKVVPKVSTKLIKRSRLKASSSPIMQRFSNCVALQSKSSCGNMLRVTSSHIYVITYYANLEHYFWFHHLQQAVIIEKDVDRNLYNH